MDTATEDRALVERAIALAVDNARAGGRPFGALVVRDGRVLGTGVNTVAADGDPLAHAEVQALRAASRAAGGAEELPGAVVVSSCEPCPVCQAAAALMGVERLVYAASKEEARSAGFDIRPLPAAMQALWREHGGQEIERVAAGDPGAPFAAWAGARPRS